MLSRPKRAGWAACGQIEPRGRGEYPPPIVRPAPWRQCISACLDGRRGARGLVLEAGRRERVFPETLTSDRLYPFWVGIQDEAELPGLRIHDCRHTWASQGVMNGAGSPRSDSCSDPAQRETTAIYAHLDDGALRDAEAQAAAVIARAMGYGAEAPPMPDEAEYGDA